MTLINTYGLAAHWWRDLARRRSPREGACVRRLEHAAESVAMKAAVIQAAPVAFEVDATLDKVERLAAEADADLVVFPEAFVSCYPRGYAFGAVLGTRTDEGRAWFRRYWESSH